MASTALNKIERAHQMYREGKYSEALGFYTEALAMAKTNPQKIALHSNRAACFLKLHHFNQAADECTSVLELDLNHTGALMLRAQTLVTLKEYHSALFDVSRLLDMNPSSEVYQNLQARLRTQLSLAPIPESEAELEEEEEDGDEAEPNINEEEQYKEEIAVERDQKAELNRTIINAEVIASEMQGSRESYEQGRDKSEPKKISSTAAVSVPKVLTNKESFKQDPKVQSNKESKQDPKVQSNMESFKQDPKVQSNKESEQDPKGWQTIPKPKGHSTLDYARWDNVEDDSSEEDDDDDDDESQPQCRFRVRTIGVRPVK
ncbi:protein unc-45 homolog A [Fagus crenata]